MPKCRDCVHWEVCREYVTRLAAARGVDLDATELEQIFDSDDCDHFQDRSRFVELPCKVGDALYTIVTGNRIREWIVADISFFSYSVMKIVITADSKDNNGTDHMRFGKDYLNHSVFLSREAAEQALKERE